MSITATEETLVDIVDSAPLVLVDFWAEWCGPCRMLAPVLDELEEEDVFKVAKVNIDQESELARNYSIMSIPTMILFKDGEAVRRIVGVKPKSTLLREVQDFTKE